jgi:signal transduction histidine kinase
MPMPRSRPLNFEVSSGLKRVLGSELITDEQVAIFELVKNSFDAAAKRVHIFFDEDTIVVADNGNGMSYGDIKEKWLLVAYSAKRDASSDFRDEAERRNFAGSKGIGRFSTDRLGNIVILQTRAKGESSGPVHRVTVDWRKFDEDHKVHFDDVNLSYRPQPDGFKTPPKLPKPVHGTIIEIRELRKPWDRDAILKLKSALAKLINPFGAEVDGFRITIRAPAEQAADNERKKQALEDDEELWPNALVNGDVGNFIFSTLQEKTTFVDVAIGQDGRTIESSLMDRGELIYRIREPNTYRKLSDSGFRCQIFFLNQSAKVTFARRMGLQSIRFGSIFLFRNGFRVYPIGEEGDDWFGIDRRKQQGYARFLGTRDVIGRVDVSGSDEDFQEASSRNDGLIETDAVAELRGCFWEHCLKRLERYLVPVSWVDKADKDSSDLSRLMTDPGRARVAAAVAALVDNDDVELLDYSKRLVGILDEKSAQFEGSLGSLRAIAEKTRDRRLFESIEAAEVRFKDLQAAEQEARRRADEERQAKEAAQTRAALAEQAAARVSEELVEERKRNLFLSSISTLDTETVINLHHQVSIYTNLIQKQIENFLARMEGKKVIEHSDVVNALERISLSNQRIMGISKFVTKANFRLEAEKIDANLADYVEQYITDVARDYLLGPMRVVVESDHKGVDQKFKPIDVSVVVDNLISNAKRARASLVKFDITHPSRTTTQIVVTDNGRGFDHKLDRLERIFEKGFTTTDGSGLGLYHVRHVLGEMNGTIEARRPADDKGAAFLVRISK